MNLKEFREAKGISVEAISRAMEISPKAYEKRESGEKEFQVHELGLALLNLKLSEEDKKTFVELF